MNHLFDAFREGGFSTPAARFLQTPEGSTMTYGDLLQASGAMANALVAFGVRPGDRVAVQVEKSPAAIVLYLATVRVGAVFLPLNTAYTITELSYFFADAEPKLVICDPTHAEAIAATLPTETSVATLDAAGAGSLSLAARELSKEFADVSRGADDLAAILYTSGTTGRSKGAMLTHGNLASNARTLAMHWRFTSSDVLIHALPIFHTHGLFVAVNVTLLTGAAMIFFAKFEPAKVLVALPHATALMGVPTFYVRLLAEPSLTKPATENMRVFISGSAPLLRETFDAWTERTGHRILERYGMTETNMNTSNPYEGERIAGTVGAALPDVAIRITDPASGATVPTGEIGMIEVRGPNVFKGYWRQPEKTAAEFRQDGFFVTGDLGTLDAQGYVRIVGRTKDLVITGGFNVYPKEVEGEIDQIAEVVESAVIGLPHPDFGEGVTAIVVRRPMASLAESDVIAALESRLARFKQPKRILFVDDLPRNTMGKVQKNVLRERYKDLYARGN